jgi:hypothetical protein
MKDSEVTVVYVTRWPHGENHVEKCYRIFYKFDNAMKWITEQYKTEIYDICSNQFSLKATHYDDGKRIDDEEIYIDIGTGFILEEEQKEEES